MSNCPKGHFKATLFHWKKANCSHFQKVGWENLVVSSIFFCGFDKAGFYLSGRTTCEKLSKKITDFLLRHVWTEKKKLSAPWINFLARMSNFRFTCPQEQFGETFVWNFAKFSFSFGHWAKILLNKAGERHRGKLSESFITSKDILKRPFWRFRKFVDSKKKT